VRAVAFVGESEVVGGCLNHEIHRWKTENGQQRRKTMQAGGRVNSVVVSHDRQWIASGDSGNKAILWNAATHEKELEFTEHSSCVYGIDISSDGTKLATVDERNVQIFSIPSGDRLLPPLPHPNVLSVKFSPDGSRFATVSVTQGLRVYNTDSGKKVFDSGPQIGYFSNCLIACAAWSADGQQLFVANKGKIIYFDSNYSSSEWSIHENRFQPSIASNGRFIACTARSSVSLWDCVSHKQIGNITTHTADVEFVALSPSGQYLACRNGANITIHDLRDVLSPEYFNRTVSVHPLMKLASLTIILLFLCPL
ncbi:hypothetical protein M404DRAFT_148418, partial [Pisolithus tinctorius Marx 270]